MMNEELYGALLHDVAVFYGVGVSFWVGCLLLFQYYQCTRDP